MAAVNLRQDHQKLLYDPVALQERVVEALSAHCGLESLFRNDDCEPLVRTSSVMLLMGERVFENGNMPEASIILNKRSKEVKQPGDLCCPGGAVEVRFDPYLARLITLPGGTLSKWPCWTQLKREEPQNAEFLSLLLATAMRECWEEMRLNPFGIRFLGPLPSQCLILFRRVIHPIVAWVSRQKEFTPSWEVERIVHIPVRSLLNRYNYAHYRIYVPPGMEWRFRGTAVDFPCYLYTHEGRAELLWGATYRIVTLFLQLIFGFTPPDIADLPLVPACIGEDYVNGGFRNGRQRSGLRLTPAQH